ncbi:hypothetical protein TcCL_NonESM11924 [Trypanosoma cruzi]|nr:hypothetical protein TcCL_NonESM11924 [Trypanosoma cruzi]
MRKQKARTPHARRLSVWRGPHSCCFPGHRASNRVFAQGAMRLRPTLRQACARATQITGNPLCRRCHPSHTEEAGPPRPPPEPPPGVSTAFPRRTTSSMSTSPCPIGGRVFSSFHNMKVHARRVHHGTPIVAEDLTRGFCDSSTVFPRSASRAGHYQKCQACQRAKNGQRNSASSNDGHSPTATPLLQPHQPLSPRQSTGGPAAHAVATPPIPPMSIRLFG